MKLPSSYTSRRFILLNQMNRRRLDGIGQKQVSDAGEGFNSLLGEVAEHLLGITKAET